MFLRRVMTVARRVIRPECDKKSAIASVVRLMSVLKRVTFLLANPQIYYY